MDVFLNISKKIGQITRRIQNKICETKNRVSHVSKRGWRERGRGGGGGGKKQTQSQKNKKQRDVGEGERNQENTEDRRKNDLSFKSLTFNVDFTVCHRSTVLPHLPGSPV